MSFCWRSSKERDKLTDGSNNLRFDAKLVGKPTSKVRNTASSVPGHVRHLSDVIIHVPAREQEHCHQADDGPEVSVLDNGENIRVGNGAKGEKTNDDGDGGDQLAPVEWPLQRWVAAWRQMALQPRVNTFGSLRAQEVESNRLAVRRSIRASGRREEEEDWSGLQLVLPDSADMVVDVLGHPPL